MKIREIVHCTPATTLYAWIGFGKKKTMFVQFVQKVIEKLKGLKHSLKYFRCDNAGDNMKTITEVFDKEGIKAEQTPPYSPEFNGVVEQRLTILLRRPLASTVNAGLNQETRQLLWAEAVSYNNFTENITISARKDKPPATFFNSDETK